MDVSLKQGNIYRPMVNYIASPAKPKFFVGFLQNHHDCRISYPSGKIIAEEEKQDFAIACFFVQEKVFDFIFDLDCIFITYY